MSKKKLFIAATALLALVSCTSDTYLGDQEALRGDVPISFDMSSPALTRTDKAGGEAASDLNNNFVVFGYKTMSDDSKQTVFTNYQANYVANTAYTTASNSANWEYVSYKNLAADMKEHEGVAAFSAKTGSGEANEAAIDQTIKYWDFSATNYKFYAYSLGTGKTGSSTTWANASLMSNNDTYTLQGDQEQLSACYISELLTVDNPSGSTPTEVNLRFLTIKSKLQLGFYETIPGYSVKNLKFYTTKDATPSGTTPALYQVYTNPAEKVLPKAGTYTVTFDENGKPQLAWAAAKSDGTQENVTFDAIAEEQLKTREYKEIEITPGEKLYLGRSSNTATMTAVKEVLPYADGADLTLKVDYTLVSRDNSGETIKAVGATAVVPAAFTQWKPNYKYTYLFKISDKSNPLIGGVEGLYPITLDAVVAAEQGGSQETITTISEPSITTFGAIYLTDATPANEKYTTYQTGKNEYQAQTSPYRLDIFVAAVDGSTVVNPTLGTNMNVYLATTTDKSSYPITEASVAEALAEISAGAKKITVTNINADASTNFGAAPAKATVVPSEDGSVLSVKCVLSADPGDWVASDANVYYSDAACTSKVTTTYADGTYYKKFDSALKLTGVKSTAETAPADKAIVVEYVKTAATYHTTGGVYTLADESAFNTEVSTNGKLYTNTDGTTELTWSVYNTDASSKAATYYRRTAVNSVGEYAYKVIRVQ